MKSQSAASSEIHATPSSSSGRRAAASRNGVIFSIWRLNPVYSFAFHNSSLEIFRWDIVKISVKFLSSPCAQGDEHVVCFCKVRNVVHWKSRIISVWFAIQSLNWNPWWRNNHRAIFEPDLFAFYFSFLSGWFPSHSHFVTNWNGSWLSRSGMQLNARPRLRSIRVE